MRALLEGQKRYSYVVPGEFSAGVKVFDLAYFPKEDRLAIASDQGFYTRVPGRITHWTIEGLKEAWHVGISPDGRFMAVIGNFERRGLRAETKAVVWEVLRK